MRRRRFCAGLCCCIALAGMVWVGPSVLCQEGAPVSLPDCQYRIVNTSPPSQYQLTFAFEFGDGVDDEEAVRCRDDSRTEFRGTAAGIRGRGGDESARWYICCDWNAEARVATGIGGNVVMVEVNLAFTVTAFCNAPCHPLRGSELDEAHTFFPDKIPFLFLFIQHQ